MTSMTFVAVALSAFLAWGAAEAQPRVDGSPFPVCAWSLVDGDHDVATTFAAGPDDDVAVVPSSGGRCTWVPEAERLIQRSGVQEMLQVRPNPAGGSAVEVASDIALAQQIGSQPVGQVLVRVSRPDGESHTEVSASRLSCLDESVEADLSVASSPSVGAIARLAISNNRGEGVLDRCRQGDLSLHRAMWSVDATDPCGSYSVEFVASSTAGAESRHNHSIDVVCFTWLTIDFETIDWDVRAGSFSTVSGDTDVATPGRPTVSNRGNAGVGVGVEMSPLRHAETGMEMGEFSASFGEGSEGWNVPAEAVLWFDAPSMALCAAGVMALSVTLEAPPTALPGVYDGDFRVWARGLTADHCGAESGGS